MFLLQQEKAFQIKLSYPKIKLKNLENILGILIHMSSEVRGMVTDNILGISRNEF